MNPFQNHDPLAPLVSVIVSMHEGDRHLWPRALASLMAQDLPHDQMEVLIAFDGPTSDEAVAFLEDAAKAADFNVELYAAEPSEAPSGYYTVPRNRALHFAHGSYIANLDVDNEFAPTHLSGLLKAIRLPGPEGQGWPHFVYSRRLYIRDEGAPEEVPVGPSPLVSWTLENVGTLVRGPMMNFVDTGDFLAGKSAYYALADRTGIMWHPHATRFGDWELVARFARVGFRGLAVDQITNLYHWTGSNLQLTRRTDEMIALAPELVDALAERGALIQ